MSGPSIGLRPQLPPPYATKSVMNTPRNAVALPNGDVLVAEALMAGLRQNYGMAPIGQKRYIAEADGVFWTPYIWGTLHLPDDAPRTYPNHFDPTGYNDHWTRNLLASPDGRTLHVPVGSAGNAGEFGMAKEKRRAAILALDLASGRERVFASGIRNPVGTAWNRPPPGCGRGERARRSRPRLHHLGAGRRLPWLALQRSGQTPGSAPEGARHRPDRARGDA